LKICWPVIFKTQQIIGQEIPKFSSKGVWPSFVSV
jgi:hypothetical protein